MSIREKLMLAAQECQQAANASAANTPTGSSPDSNDTVRKIRTHRLVQLGAIADQYLDTVGLPPEAVEELLRELVELPQAGDIIRRHRRPE